MRLQHIAMALLMISTACGDAEDEGAGGDEIGESPSGSGPSGTTGSPSGGGPTNPDPNAPPPNNGLAPEDDDKPWDRPTYDPLDCPESMPAEGASCGSYLLCSYGDSPRFDCRATLQCVNGLWSRKQRPGDCEAAECPRAKPTNDLTCELSISFSDNGNPCAYTRVLCYCSECPFGDCQPEPRWECLEQSDRACPDIQPNQGDPCFEQGKDCSYGYPCNGGGQWICRQGGWFRVFEECND